MNTNKIPFYVENVYGQQRAVLAPNEGQEVFVSKVQKISGKQTLSQVDLEALGYLGFEFVQIPKPNSFPLEVSKKVS